MSAVNRAIWLVGAFSLLSCAACVCWAIVSTALQSRRQAAQVARRPALSSVK